MDSTGVVYYSNSYHNVDDNTVETYIKLVDDPKLPQASLSRRRLAMKNMGAPLYPLRRAVFFMGDFLKLAKPGYWFIDSNGYIFTYRKSIKAVLTFKRITKVIPGKSTGSIVEVAGIPERFKTVFQVNPGMRYAGIIEYRGIHIFYGVYDRQYRDSWRKI